MGNKKEILKEFIKFVRKEIINKNKKIDKVGNKAIDNIDDEIEIKTTIKKLEKEMSDLKTRIEEVEIRLEGLKYREREILFAYYI